MQLRLDLFFENIIPKCPHQKSKGIFEITLFPEYNPAYKHKIHTFNSVKKLQENIKYLVNYQGKIRNVIVNVPQTRFVDSATVLLFSFCIEYLMTKLPFVNVDVRVKNNNSYTGNFTFYQTHISLMNSFSENLISRRKYIQMCKELTIDLKHEYFYKIQQQTLEKKDISILETEIETFLKNIGETDYDYIDKLISIVSELAGNAIEHSNEPTLIYIKRFQADIGDLYLINIVCFSNLKIFSDLSKKYYENPDHCYGRLKQAYEYHKPYFSEKYRENHFFMTAALQPGITSREDYSSGGVGLPSFVEKINKSTIYNSCYVVCEKDVIYFHDDNLGIQKDENGLIREVGLNRSCSFMKDIPNPEIIRDSPIFINGVLYNIILLRDEREVSHE